MISAIGGDPDWPADGPPWPLTRAEIDAFAGDRLKPVSIDQVSTPSGSLRWQATFVRPPAG